ncbi:MAG: AMP-binding protein [Mycobacterium sp.]
MSCADKSLVTYLAAFGDRPAVVTATEELSYRALAHRVDEAAAAFGDRRRLVLLPTHNELGTLIPYLGALAGNHVVLPVPPDRDVDSLQSIYGPDSVVERDGSVVELGPPVGELLHDDLALLLSTSGSTGSPKLVRLSRDNLVSNAESIAQYLSITEEDCAATTLPMSYCYGLSVIHSHLARGASLMLTDRSVVDDNFWDLFRACRATSFAGVPYTFELLDRVGFADLDLPHLRYVTQAGGRLPPERVRHFAELGERQGWELVVMYGATEATARMAYLPAHLATSRPTSIGQPIPGGSFDIEPVDGWERGTGELVYRGRNVMLGYAHQRDDLALGRTVHELRTGDIARRGPDGLYEVIGRSHRFVKLFGLRVDLGRVETLLKERGVAALCTDISGHDGGGQDGGGQLVVAVSETESAARIRGVAAVAAGVPADAVTVVGFPQLPVMSSGKPDYAAVRAAAVQQQPRSDTDLRRLFADVVGVDISVVTAQSTFLGLGGTSMNYVALSVRLERLLGGLPPNWQQLPIAALERYTPSSSRAWLPASLETSVLLRAVAIVLIVGSHAGLFELWGGAHILLGIAGYNFGRFCLTAVPRAERIRHLRATIGWIAVPSIVWIAIALLITDDYHLSNLLLANKILGPHDSMTAGRLWFIEVLVYTLIALTLLCAVPLIDRLERRGPFGFAMIFLAVGVALRYDVLGLDLGTQAGFTYLAFWFFAVGWAAAKAQQNWQRALVTVILGICLVDYFGELLRVVMVFTGLALVIWLPSLRCPVWLPPLAGALAEASLYTYLTHFQVYPLFGEYKLIGVVAALLVGLLVTRLINVLRRRWSRRAVKRVDTDAELH